MTIVRSPDRHREGRLERAVLLGCAPVPIPGTSAVAGTPAGGAGDD